MKHKIIFFGSLALPFLFLVAMYIASTMEEYVWALVFCVLVLISVVALVPVYCFKILEE